MSRDHAHDETRLTDPDLLVDHFRGGIKAIDERKVGTEHEKFGFDDETLRPLAYEGPRGIRAILEGMADRFGWVPSYDQGALTALESVDGALTLEPGGQFELSGATRTTIFETRDELARHLREVDTLATELGQRWVFLGLNPWDDLDDVPWMPKSRYGIMRRYLPTRASMPHWMMKMTCTIQANYDYVSEADAMEILRLGVKLSPLVTALFANSPVRLGKEGPWTSWRMEIWEHTDPDRSGAPSFLFRDDSGFADYAQYVLDVPMFFVRRNGAYVDLAGASFRDLMAGRIEGLEATWGDWELHLSTAFPEVRMKRYLEMRGADGASPAHVLALPALWKGLWYDAAARRDAAALVDGADEAEFRSLYRVSRQDGLDGTWRGVSLRELASDLVRIAGEGLDRQAGGGPSERVFLAPLLDRGRACAPAEAFREVWRRSGGDRRAIVDAFDLRRYGIP